MATSLARRLSRAVAAHETSPDETTRRVLLDLTRQAAEHVRNTGTGTVDHIVLAAVLRPIAADHPEVAEILQASGWQWL